MAAVIIVYTRCLLKGLLNWFSIGFANISQSGSIFLKEEQSYIMDRIA